MKLNLKKKLAPYTIKDFEEEEGKEQIEATLKNIGMEPDEILGNNAEPLPDYPDDNPLSSDPMDLAKSDFIEKHMRGY